MDWALCDPRNSAQERALAVARLIGDQDVEVAAQHASSTSAAVTARIGRALLYLNDQGTAGHFRYRAIFAICSGRPDQ